MMPRLPLVLLGALCLATPGQTSPPPAAAGASPLADGGQRLSAGDFPGAIRVLGDATRARPGDGQAFRLLAIAYLHTDRPREAQKAAETAWSLAPAADPTRATVAVLLGKARYAAFSQEFSRVFDKAQSVPDMQQLLSQMASHRFETARGDVIVEKGDPEAQDDYLRLRSSLREEIDRLQKTLNDSEAAYQQALDADPKAPGAHDGLGLIRIAQGYGGEARREFQAEMLQHGPSGIVYQHLGELDAAEGHDQAAFENLRRSVALAPQMQAPYEALAALYSRRHDRDGECWARAMAALVSGDQARALSEFGRASGDTPDLLRGQALLALARRRPDEARRFLTRAQALGPRDPLTLAMLGDLEENLGHHTEAVTWYKQALDADPACDSAWYGLGLTYDARNDRESALADYAQALQTNPNNALAKLNLAQDQADLGRRAEAAATLRDYLQRFPTASNTYDVLSALTQLEGK